jgi:ferritin
MLSDRLQDAINRQINDELFSAHLYLSMSAYFESLDLNGFARWMKLQFEEETAHALKLFDYVNDRDGRVTLHSIDQPQVEFESPHSVMRSALEHERLVTSMINDLYALAISERDYPTHVLLEWFVSEQVEEEKVLNEIVAHMDLIGNDGTGLIIMDQRLGDRTADAGADGAAEAAEG